MWLEYWEWLQKFNDDSDNSMILIKNCPLISPSVEIAKQGNAAIIRYFEGKARLE